MSNIYQGTLLLVDSLPKFNITIPFEKESGFVKLCVYSMNEEVFQKGYEILSSRVLTVTDHSDTEITGSF